jgi:3D (Asp-Asp-Asp) domain-containing protein
MSSSFNKIVGISCITLFLQFSAKAQILNTSQTQSPKSSTPSSNISSISSTTGTTGTGELKSQLALVTDKDSEMARGKVSNYGPHEVVAEKKMDIAIAEPKVGLKTPTIQFKMKPLELKLDGRSFAEPTLELPASATSFHATAYALQGRTRSGIRTRRGVIAADPRVIPLGSVVQIKTPGYSGVYTVHDTGKRIKGNVIDVWVESPREARTFGRRQIKLHVLRLGPKTDREK